MKYEVDDLVHKGNVPHDIFEIVATKLDKRDVLVPDGAEYVIRKQGDDQYNYVFEEDIYLITE
ncbi:hypothetical protein [Sphingobacterium sp.]|uniref:hypothetical protein n=1 Tax=Sphingobacterium sp. TaxID=341027 RepID=UPI0031D43D66